MEVSGKKGTAPLEHGTQSRFDFFCQPCNIEGDHLEAEGYCETCKEYLCNTCFKHHRRPTATKHHVLLGKEQMPRAYTPSNLKPIIICTQTCRTHAREIIKYFCGGHDQLGCSECLRQTHRQCKNVLYIPDVAGAAKHKREYDTLNKHLNELLKSVELKKKDSEKHMKQTMNCGDDAIAAIDDFQEKATLHFEKLANAMKKKVEAEKNQRQARLQRECTSFNGVILGIEQLSLDLATTHKSERKGDSFVAVKNGKKRFQAMTRDTSKYNQKEQYSNIIFKPNEELLSQQISFGWLTVEPVQQKDEHLTVTTNEKSDMDPVYPSQKHPYFSGVQSDGRSTVTANETLITVPAFGVQGKHFHPDFQSDGRSTVAANETLITVPAFGVQGKHFHPDFQSDGRSTVAANETLITVPAFGVQGKHFHPDFQKDVHPAVDTKEIMYSFDPLLTSTGDLAIIRKENDPERCTLKTSAGSFSSVPMISPQHYSSTLGGLDPALQRPNNAMEGMDCVVGMCDCCGPVWKYMDISVQPNGFLCSHVFCRNCMLVNERLPACPVCGVIRSEMQPYGTMTIKTQRWTSCSGYEQFGRIDITYKFPNGVQEEEHPTPGARYRGITRVAYLPDNTQGQKISKMLKVAFDRKLVFTIGTSTTTGQSGVITWNGIQHKTNPSPNTQFGYPDPYYLDRVTEELAAKGVTERDIY